MPSYKYGPGYKASGDKQRCELSYALSADAARGTWSVFAIRTKVIKRKRQRRIKRAKGDEGIKREHTNTKSRMTWEQDQNDTVQSQ